MIHHERLEEIMKRYRHGSFLYPGYGSCSIAEIPPSILHFFKAKTDRTPLDIDLLKNGGYQKLLFFFVDGFAYDHFVEFEKEIPFFHSLATKADVFPLTSVFPSTTSAALTALQTNKTPQEHGLPEWTVYLEELGRISFGTLREREGDPQMLYNGDTLYTELKAVGVTSYVFTYESYFPSAYSRVTQKDAVVITFKNEHDLFPKLRDCLEKENGKAYIFVYWGEVDGIEHLYGPKSKEHIAALQKVATALQEEFIKKLSPTAAHDTCFILSSDHGQISIKNEDIIYLNTYIDLDDTYYRTEKNIIFPTGAPHDVFLHIEESKITEALQYLREKLDGKAEVLTTEEALERGLFGLNKPLERFKKRIGDILILPYEGFHVWYQHTPNYIWQQLGIHGGLSRAEMLVPFAIAPLKNLQ